MRLLPLVLIGLVAGGSLLVVSIAREGSADPCDAYSNCVSSSVVFLRANPDHTLYLGDSFSIPLSIAMGPNTTGYTVSWSYDASVFTRSGDTFTATGNKTGTFSITESVTFTGSASSSTLTVSQSITIIQLFIALQTRVVNVTDAHGFVERNLDGSFYRNDTFCDSWNATFQFAAQRTDIKINVTSEAPALHILNYSADPLGRTGRFCYVVGTGATYKPYNVTLMVRALNWQGKSLALKISVRPFSVVQYDPQFTTYAYMLYGNVTTPSSLERPWVFFVRYDGNYPGYSYQGDSNTLPFNGSETLEERAYFSNFTFASLGYQPYSSRGAFSYLVTNTTSSLRYSWLNEDSSVPLQGQNRVEKYVFEAAPSSLSSLLGEGYVYQNITMKGHWTHEGGSVLKQTYWLVPYLWSGNLTIISVGSDGQTLPDTPITLTIQNPQPLDDWLVNNFEAIFGNDTQAVRAFEADLYPTNSTMTFSGRGSLRVWFNQTSLSPPFVSITAGSATLSGNFTFVPTFIDSAVVSAPDAFSGTVYSANATIPLWTYNMFQRNLAFLPVSTTMDRPSTFLELVNSSSGWVAGNTTEPQTPSAFALQEYGFWPLGENLTVYVNLQGGGVTLLGVQKITSSQYQASFYVEPWSGGMSSVQLVQDGGALENESTSNPAAYPSPLPQGLTGLFSITYPATGQDVKAVFTNVWGVKTTVDLGVATAPAPLASLIPETTVVAFGLALIVWVVATGVWRTRRSKTHS